MLFEVKLLKDVLFIHPLNRNDPHATNVIAHLALQFIEVLGSKFYLVLILIAMQSKSSSPTLYVVSISGKWTNLAHSGLLNTKNSRNFL